MGQSCTGEDHVAEFSNAVAPTHREKKRPPTEKKGMFEPSVAEVELERQRLERRRSAKQEKKDHEQAFKVKTAGTMTSKSKAGAVASNPSATVLVAAKQIPPPKTEIDSSLNEVRPVAPATRLVVCMPRQAAKSGGDDEQPVEVQHFTVPTIPTTAQRFLSRKEEKRKNLIFTPD